MKLSVVIPCYNNERFLQQTFDSLRNQTFQDFEVIFVDDGSTDASCSIAYRNHSDFHGHIIHQPHSGIYQARNRGVQEAEGEYLCFLDADDLISPERFAKQVECLDSHGDVGLVFSDTNLIDEQGQEIGAYRDDMKGRIEFLTDIPSNLCWDGCFIAIQSVMMRRQVFLSTGPLEWPGAICDWMKWIEISNLTKVHYIPEVLAYWRRHSGCNSIKTNRCIQSFMVLYGLIRILRKHPDIRIRVGRRIYWHYVKNWFVRQMKKWGVRRRNQ